MRIIDAGIFALDLAIAVILIGLGTKTYTIEFNRFDMHTLAQVTSTTTIPRGICLHKYEFNVSEQLYNGMYFSHDSCMFRPSNITVYYMSTNPSDNEAASLLKEPTFVQEIGILIIILGGLVIFIALLVYLPMFWESCWKTKHNTNSITSLLVDDSPL